MYPLLFSKDKGFLSQLLYKEAPIEVPRNNPAKEPKKITLVDIKKSDLPKTCKIINSTTVELTGDGGSLKLGEGLTLKPISLKEGKLLAEFVFSGNTFKGLVLISNTDLLKAVQQKRAKLAQRNKNALQAKGKQSQNTKSSKKPQETTKVKPQKNPVNLSNSEITTLIQEQFSTLDTVEGAAIKQSKAIGNKQAKGKHYQVGQIVFAKDTLIGKRNIRVNAYIFAGEIELWMLDNTSQEIK